MTAGSDTKAAPVAQPLSGLPPALIELARWNQRRPSGPAAVAEAARRLLPAGDVRIRVAELMAADTMARRQQTIDALKGLPQNSLAVVLALGMAQLWAGQLKDAVATLERVKRRPVRLLRHERRRPAATATSAPDIRRYILPGSRPRVAAALQAAVAATRRAGGVARARLAARAHEPPGRSRAAQAARASTPRASPSRWRSTVLGFDKDNADDRRSDDAHLPPRRRRIPKRRGALPPGAPLLLAADSQDAAAYFSQVESDAPHSHYAPIGRCSSPASKAQRRGLHRLRSRRD